MKKTTKKVPPLKIIDFNGTGRWSLQFVQEIYAAYARQLDVTAPLNLVPPRYKGHEVERIYPVMFEVIEGIEQGDKACIEIGVECIEENQWLFFGRIIEPIWDLFLEYKADTKAVFSNPVDTGYETMEQRQQKI